MKVLCAVLIVSTGILSASAEARGRGHVHSGARVVVRAPVVVHPVPRARVFIAAPIAAVPLYHSYYYPPAYYPPAPAYYPTIPYPAPAPAYIEQPVESARQPSANDYWYYCAGSAAYYPYVKECPGGWQVVSPRPS
jgi:hypothetical protein